MSIPNWHPIPTPNSGEKEFYQEELRIPVAPFDWYIRNYEETVTEEESKIVDYSIDEHPGRVIIIQM